MIGTAKGFMVSTEDLTSGTMVSVDHELYRVDAIRPSERGVVVDLAPAHGDVWELHVYEEDMAEPMWELP